MLTLKCCCVILLCLFSNSKCQTTAFANDVSKSLVESVVNITDQARSTLSPRNLHVFRNDERNKNVLLPNEHHLPNEQVIFENIKINQYAIPGENKQIRIVNRTLPHGNSNSKISRNHSHIKHVQIVGNYSNINDFGGNNGNRKQYNNYQPRISAVQKPNPQERILNTQNININYEKINNAQPKQFESSTYNEMIVGHKEENDVVSQNHNVNVLKPINTNNSTLNLNENFKQNNTATTEELRAFQNAKNQPEQTDKDEIVFPSTSYQLPPADTTNVTVGTRFIINGPERECAQGKVLQNGHCRNTT